jgi:2-iminobutanoate/2-iminopropanoate deaminase
LRACERNVRSFAPLRMTPPRFATSFVIPGEVEESLIVGFCFAAKIVRMKKIISTNEAPAAIGAYSQAVRSGRFFFCSGQIPLDPKSGQVVPGDIAAQTRRVLDNIAALLRAEGLTFDNVVKTTIFLTDLSTFQAVNDIYGSYFKQDPPARSTVQVSALPKGVNVEIEVIAAGEEGEQTAYDTSG